MAPQLWRNSYFTTYRRNCILFFAWSGLFGRFRLIVVAQFVLLPWGVVVVKRCHSGFCNVNISGHGNQSGICEDNSAGQCAYRKLDVSGSAVSSSCLA